jgi:hypothetical protein
MMPRKPLSPEQREKNRLRSNAWAAANRERAAERARQWYAENKDDALARQKQARAEDPEGFRQRRRAHRQVNIAAHRERERVRREGNPGLRVVAAERTRKWAAENAERKKEADATYYARTREQRIASVKAYRQKNPGKVRALSARKKATIRERTPPWLTKDDWRAIDALYETATRLSVTSGEPWHVDHIIPLRGKTVSGLHVPSNLRVIRASENMRKKNRFDPSETHTIA